MTLIKSISGIRGTIGGKVGDNLTPVDAVKFASAYGTWLKSYSKSDKLTVVIGRDQNFRTNDSQSCSEYFNRFGHRRDRFGIVDNTNRRSCCSFRESPWWHYSNGFSQSETVECFEIVE